jgi:hypothetical protein
LDKDKNKRLGKVNDVEEIISHPWFSDFKVEDLMEKKVVAPYIPVIKEADDTSNFDERFS